MVVVSEVATSKLVLTSLPNVVLSTFSEPLFASITGDDSANSALTEATKTNLGHTSWHDSFEQALRRPNFLTSAMNFFSRSLGPNLWVHHGLTNRLVVLRVVAWDERAANTTEVCPHRCTDWTANEATGQAANNPASNTASQRGNHASSCATNPTTSPVTEITCTPDVGEVLSGWSPHLRPLHVVHRLLL